MFDVGLEDNGDSQALSEKEWKLRWTDYKAS